MRISDWSSDVCSSDLLLAADGVKARVIDLRWLGPVDEDKLVDAVGEAERILIVDECRITGSQSEALMALFVERTPGKALARIAAQDSFIPLGKAATLTLPSRDSLAAAAREILAKGGISTPFELGRAHV